MKRVLALMAEGFEETELVVPVDVLRRGGVEVVLCSIADDGSWDVEGAHGISVSADSTLDEVSADGFDAVLLPGGGPGTAHLEADERVLEIVWTYASKGRIVAAICAAPRVLKRAGILKGRRITSFPAEQAKLDDGSLTYLQDRVVVDGNLITSRGAGTAAEFGLALLEALEGKETAEKVRVSALFA